MLTLKPIPDTKEKTVERIRELQQQYNSFDPKEYGRSLECLLLLSDIRTEIIIIKHTHNLFDLEVRLEEFFIK